MTVLADIRTTLFPPAGSRHGPLPPLLVVLTVSSGLIDAFSYLELGHVFVVNMTGNVVFLGMALAGAHGFSAGSSLTALGGFVVGAWTCGRLAVRHVRRRGRMLAAAAAVAGATGHADRGAARWVILVLVAVTAGAQNATVQKLDVPDLSTTVLTRTITGIARDNRLAGGEPSHLGRRALAVVAMLVGAVVGATVVLHVRPVFALVVAAVLLAAVAVGAGTASRSGPAWETPG